MNCPVPCSTRAAAAGPMEDLLAAGFRLDALALPEKGAGDAASPEHSRAFFREREVSRIELERLCQEHALQRVLALPGFRTPRVFPVSVVPASAQSADGEQAGSATAFRTVGLDVIVYPTVTASWPSLCQAVRVSSRADRR